MHNYPKHETVVLRGIKSSLCQRCHPHSASTAQTRHTQKHEHLLHLSYRVWASHGRVSDLEKYLPFWSWVNSAVPRVLLGLRRWWCEEEQQRGQQKTFRVCYEGIFRSLGLNKICIFHFQTLEVYLVYHMSMYILYTVKHKHQKYTIYTIQATCFFMYTITTGWVDFVNITYVCIHWLVNVCVQYVQYVMMSVYGSTWNSWRSCGLKIMTTDFRRQLCLLIVQIEFLSLF